MKMTEITLEDIKSYLRVDGDDEDTFISAALEASRQYIRTYTAQDDEFLDTCADIPMAVFALCADMYDVRQATVNNDKANPLVRQILDSYSRNWIG